MGAASVLESWDALRRGFDVVAWGQHAVLNEAMTVNKGAEAQGSVEAKTKTSHWALPRAVSQTT